MIEKGLFCFGLLAFLFPVRPCLGRDLDPAHCLVSGNYNLIRLSESTDETSCRQDCVAEPGCHMAVVSTPLSGSAECLLVDCLNRSQLSRPRDPSGSIAVYPKSSDEVLRCRDLEDRTSFSSCRTGAPRFFYNRTSYSCERFFSGCGSNRNSFHSREGCEALCSEKYLCYRPVEYGQRPPSHLSTDPPSQDPPSQDPNVFFYNVSSCRCEGFHFRGGASNGNMFSSVEQCEGLCGGVGVTTSRPAVVSTTTTRGPAVEPDAPAPLTRMPQAVVFGLIVFIVFIIIVIIIMSVLSFTFIQNYCEDRRPSYTRYRKLSDGIVSL